MSDSKLVPFKAKKTFNLFNRKFERGEGLPASFLEVEVLIKEGLADIIPLSSVDYRKLLNEKSFRKNVGVK